MAKQLKTCLTFVQDETGSMGQIRQETVSAFNHYFKTLKDEKIQADVMVWQFSDMGDTEQRVRLLYEGVLGRVPKLNLETYRPRGTTPLLDAVGTAISQAESKKADRHLFIVQTDGLENCSREYTLEQVAQLVAEKERSDKWTLVFLGAGINQWVNEATRMGAQPTSSVPYATYDTAVAYASLGTTTAQFLHTGSLKAQSLGSDTEKEIKRRKKKSPSS